MVYGYCRISTRQQNIERQERNIVQAFPNAKIIREAFTGTTTNRPVLKKLLKQVKEGDTIVFDSVSRMSRNADEGYKLYQQLFSKGVELVFFKEPYINTQTYKEISKQLVPMTGTAVDSILKGVNEYLMTVAKEQIKIAFDQAEKEVTDLRQRTKEGMETARRSGKQIGQRQGVKLTTKKSVDCKEIIVKHSKDFSGSLNDKEVMKLTGLSRNTFYKYKKELKAEL